MYTIGENFSISLEDRDFTKKYNVLLQGAERNSALFIDGGSNVAANDAPKSYIAYTYITCAIESYKERYVSQT